MDELRRRGPHRSRARGALVTLFGRRGNMIARAPGVRARAVVSRARSLRAHGDVARRCIAGRFRDRDSRRRRTRDRGDREQLPRVSSRSRPWTRIASGLTSIAGCFARCRAHHAERPESARICSDSWSTRTPPSSRARPFPRRSAYRPRPKRRGGRSRRNPRGRQSAQRYEAADGVRVRTIGRGRIDE
jgi:hypothetical protein